MIKEFDEMNRRWAQNHQSKILEANIYAQGNGSERYTIKLRNGATAVDVPGPFGLKIGQSVTVSSFPGKVGRYIILTKGYRASENITIVKV